MDAGLTPVLKDMFFLNGQQLWEELSLVIKQHKFYVPGWTLRVELILSFLVPILFWIGKKRIEYLFALLPIFLFVGNHVFTYNIHFTLGVILAYYYPQIRDYNWRASWIYQYRYGLFFLVFLLYSIGRIDNTLVADNPIGSFLGQVNIELFQLTGIASALVIMWAIGNTRVQNFLNERILIFFGEISYGIYLFHWLYVMLVMENWERLMKPFSNSFLGASLLFLGVFIATIVTAYIVYHLVERPFISLGRRTFQVSKSLDHTL